MFLEEISSKITLVWGHKYPCRECPSVSPSVAPPDSSLPPKSGDKLSNQPARPSGTKPPVIDAPIAAINVSKYSKDDLQKIFKAILEARAPVFDPAPASVVSEVPQEKLKARFPDVYCGKSHMDCSNFCQQYEDFFATPRAIGPTQIPFAASFLRDQINFRW